LRQVIVLDLLTCTREELTQVHGMGMKTASYFLSCTRKDEKYFVGDTHILKFCRSMGWTKSIQTPEKKHYLELEKKYLDFCKENMLDSTELDLELWKFYSGNIYTLPKFIKEKLDEN
jgi:thermostable 8-oxoguanine DNA glycosylase